MLGALGPAPVPSASFYCGMAVPLLWGALCKTVVASLRAWGCCAPFSSPASLHLSLSQWDYLPLLLLQLLPGIPNPQNDVSSVILVIKSGS